MFPDRKQLGFQAEGTEETQSDTQLVEKAISLITDVNLYLNGDPDFQKKLSETYLIRMFIGRENLQAGCSISLSKNGSDYEIRHQTSKGEFKLLIVRNFKDDDSQGKQDFIGLIVEENGEPGVSQSGHIQYGRRNFEDGQEELYLDTQTAVEKVETFLHELQGSET